MHVRVCCRRSATREPELAENIAHVPRDCFVADAELRGDRAICFPSRHKSESLELTPRQLASRFALAFTLRPRLELREIVRRSEHRERLACARDLHRRGVCIAEQAKGPREQHACASPFVRYRAHATLRTRCAASRATCADCPPRAAPPPSRTPPPHAAAVRYYVRPTPALVARVFADRTSRRTPRARSSKSGP